MSGLVYTYYSLLKYNTAPSSMSHPIDEVFTYTSKPLVLI